MKNIHTIRRIVATMANRLKKIGLTLSAAFKKAWALIKGKAIESKVAGVTKGNRQKALHRILTHYTLCLLYTSPSPRAGLLSRMPSSA